MSTKTDALVEEICELRAEDEKLSVHEAAIEDRLGEPDVDNTDAQVLLKKFQEVRTTRDRIRSRVTAIILELNG